MTRRDLVELGIPPGEILALAGFLVRHARERGLGEEEIRTRLRALLESPEQNLEDDCFGSLARALRTGGDPG